jgi:hypothetical protein
MQMLQNRSIPLLLVSELPIFITGSNEKLLSEYLEEIVSYHRRFLQQTISDSSTPIFDLSPTPSRPPTPADIVQKVHNSKRNRVISSFPDINVPVPKLYDERTYIKISSPVTASRKSPKESSRFALKVLPVSVENSESVASAIKIGRVPTSSNLTKHDDFPLSSSMCSTDSDEDRSFPGNTVQPIKVKIRKDQSASKVNIHVRDGSRARLFPVRLSRGSASDDNISINSGGSDGSRGAVSLLAHRFRKSTDETNFGSYDLKLSEDLEDCFSISSFGSDHSNFSGANEKSRSHGLSEFSIWAKKNSSQSVKRVKERRQKKLSTSPSASIVDGLQSSIQISQVSMKVAQKKMSHTADSRVVLLPMVDHPQHTEAASAAYLDDDSMIFSSPVKRIII